MELLGPLGKKESGVFDWPVSDPVTDSGAWQAMRQQPSQNQIEKNGSLPKSCNQADLIDLIARTVNCIFKSIEEITQIKSLIAAIAGLSSTDDNLQSLPSRLSTTQSSCNSQKSGQSKFHMGNTSETMKSCEKGKNFQHLIFQPHKICVTICNYKRLLPSWENKCLAKKRLTVNY